MGAILAATIIFTVLGASMGLLYAHLDQVDEYNARVSETLEVQRRVVQENILMSATPSGGSAYEIGIQNSGSDPVRIIEIRSLSANGTITPADGLGGVELDGFAADTLNYTAPGGTDGGASLLAITSMGNTFSVALPESEAATQADENPGTATINGMGLGSRLVQIEHTGRAIYGSDTWNGEESLQPYIEMDAGETSDPPKFAAVLLDSDRKGVVPVDGYARDRIITVSPDGVARNLPKPNVLAYTHASGDASVSSNSTGISVSGGTRAILKLAPEMFGKTLFFDAETGGGRFEVVTSPYGGLANNMTVHQVREKCEGTIWTYPRDPSSRNTYGTFRHASLIAVLGWGFDLSKLDAFIIHEQFVPSMPITAGTKSYSNAARDAAHLHNRYWDINHTLLAASNGDGSEGRKLHARSASDHGNTRSFPLYFAHPGNMELQYNSTTIQFPDPGVLVRYNDKLSLPYAPTVEMSLAMSQRDSGAHVPHAINDDEPIVLKQKKYYVVVNGTYHIFSNDRLTPYATIAGNSTELSTNYGLNIPRVWQIPFMSFDQGSAGNEDYTTLKGVTFNAINVNPVSGPTLSGDRDQTAVPFKPINIHDGNNLCIIAEKPYKVEGQISSDVRTHKMTLPDYQDIYAEHLYILAHTDGSQMLIRAVTEEGERNEEKTITGLAPNTPFRIVGAAGTLHSGTASPTGSIPFIDGIPESFSLHTYPESTSYRGSFSTVVFDPHSGSYVKIAGPEDRIYTVHAWAQIPVVGNVTVSATEVRALNGTALRLEYLDGQYSAAADDGGRIWVPVIPGQHSIHMKINGVDAVLLYADVLGSSNVRVIPPETSTVSKTSAAPITQIRAAAGVTAYAIAASEGDLGAVIQGTVSGSAYIDHVYRENRVVIPCGRDPLTGWIQVYKNGSLFYSGDKFVDYEPEITKDNYVDSRGLRHAKTTFTYDKWSINESVSVPVKTGDVVEFHIRSKILAEADLEPIPGVTGCGPAVITTRVSSEASATANIHAGSIIIG